MKNKRKRWDIVRYLIIISLLLFLLCLPRKLFDVPYSTVVNDRNGELLGARIADDGQWRFPLNDTVSEKFKTCLIAYEDRHFYCHFGVNPASICRALIQNVKGRRVVSGGSTLTMQTIRLSRGMQRTVFEKIIEMILAVRIECRYSKSEILALYSAHAPFGGNVVGLEAASWRYFGRSADELSWAEAAMLAVLPNAPSMIHLSKNQDKLLEKRNRLLKYLHEKGKIENIDYELAVSEPLPSESMMLPQIAPHLVTYFYLKNRGSKINSTISKSVQMQVENITGQWNSVFARADIRNIAAIVIDVKTNEVVAYCGNAGKQAKDVDIIRSPRSTGSILKPFLYYAALDEGLILPNTLLPDIPLNINGFVPQNFNMQYDGALPASQVIARSLNIPSVYLLQEYGVPKFYDFLKKAGFKTLTKTASHYGLSLILGGAEATLWDISFAYSDMSRALQKLPETTRMLSLQEKKETLPEVFNSGAVWQVFDAIKEVNRAEEIDWRYIPSMQTVAWKTGTSYGFRDAWAVGATKNYVVGVWVGNANGEGKPELIGAKTAGPVMFEILNILPSSRWFEYPENKFVEAEVCRKSGYLKGRFCEETDTLKIVPQGLKTESCPYCISVNLSPDERYRVYESCLTAEQTVIQKNWFVLPPVWEWYYKQHHPDYKSLPPFMAGCSEISENNPMAFMYPQSNATVHLPRQLDGSEGEITFELAHRNSNSTIFWHIDSEYLTTTKVFHKYTFRPSIGKHTITVVDDAGNSLSIRITVK
jgi:penicillin-binding protein 1C